MAKYESRHKRQAVDRLSVKSKEIATNVVSIEVCGESSSDSNITQDTSALSWTEEGTEPSGIKIIINQTWESKKYKSNFMDILDDTPKT